MADETLLQTFFTRLGFQADTSGLDDYKNKLVDLSSSLLKLSGIASLSLGGLFAFTQKATSQMADINRMSENYGIATDTIAAFNKMGREFDITTESMMGGLQNLSVGIGAAALGVGRLSPILKKYGLDVHAAGGGTKDMQTFLGDVAERMTKLSGFEQNMLVRRLGLDPSMVRVLRNGRAEFERLYSTAAKGLPFTAEDYRKADEFELAFRNARAALGVLSSQIALTLMPLFQQALESFLTWWRTNGETVMTRIKFWVTQAANWAKNVLTFFARFTKDTNLLGAAMKVLGAAVAIIVANKLGSWAATAVESIGGLVSWIGRLTGVTKTLTAAQEAQAVAQGLSTAEIWLIVAAIAILIGLILLAIDDFETWRKGGESLTGKFIGWFNKVGDGMQQLRDVIRGVWTAINGIWKFAAEAWGDMFKQMAKAIQAWWPIVKIALIVVGGFLAITLVAVVALAGAFLWLLAKVATIALAVAGWVAKLITSPKEALADLSAWLQSVIDSVSGWLASVLGKAGEAIAAWVPSIIAQIAAWISAGVDKVVAAFVGIFTSALSAVTAIVQAWWDEWMGKIAGLPAKVKSAITGVATAAPAVGAMGYNPATGGYEAPPILSPTPPTPPGFGSKSLDTSQTNSNNITQHNTINVNNGKEAADTTKQLQDNARKQQQQTLVPLQPVTI